MVFWHLTQDTILLDRDQLLVTARESKHGSQVQQMMKCPLHFSSADFVCFPQMYFLRGASCVILTCPTLLLQQHCQHRHVWQQHPFPARWGLLPLIWDTQSHPLSSQRALTLPKPKRLDQHKSQGWQIWNISTVSSFILFLWLYSPFLSLLPQKWKGGEERELRGAACCWNGITQSPGLAPAESLLQGHLH